MIYDACVHLCIMNVSMTQSIHDACIHDTCIHNACIYYACIFWPPGYVHDPWPWYMHVCMMHISMMWMVNPFLAMPWFWVHMDQQPTRKITFILGDFSKKWVGGGTVSQRKSTNSGRMKIHLLCSQISQKPWDGWVGKHIWERYRKKNSFFYSFPK